MKTGLIEFDGEIITYPNGNKIYIQYDSDYGQYTFDVVNKEGWYLKTDMCLLHQAHQIALGDVKCL